MDEVASAAGLAKGLVYYYFKTKQELFREMFEWGLNSLADSSGRMLEETTGLDPIEALVDYCLSMLGLVEADLRMLRFAMRLPFDARAVFGPEKWRSGMERSRVHQASLARMIRAIAEAGGIPPLDADRAAACFWAVFMASALDFTRMIANGGSGGSGDAGKGERARRNRELLEFCFRMLGLRDEEWSIFVRDEEAI